MKGLYKEYLSHFEKKNSIFSLIEALECLGSFNLQDSVLPELTGMMKDDTEYNLSKYYLMNKREMAKFPDLDKGKDDMNMSRVSPFLPINPFKAHYCNPYYNRPTTFKLNRPNIGVRKLRKNNHH